MSPVKVREVDIQIRTTNADVDDGGQLLSGETLPLAAADLLGELLHVLKNVVDAARGVHDVDVIDLHVPAANVSQSSVVDGAVLGKVDLLAGKHVIPLLLNASLLGELDEEVKSLISEEVLAKVEENIGADALSLEGAGESIETIRVRGESLLQNKRFADIVAVSLELRPGGESVGGGHFG